MKKFSSFIIISMLFMATGLCQHEKGSRLQTGFNFFKNEYRKYENFAFSPSNLENSLALLWLSSAGQTRKEIEGILCEDDCLNRVEYVLRRPAELQYSIANAIWYDSGFTILDSFKANTSKLNLEVLSANFKEPFIASEKVNAWYSLQTNNKVNNFIEPKMMSTASLLIGTALHTSLKWADEFDPSMTTQGDFTGFDGKTYNAEYMSKESTKLFLFQNIFLSMLSLPLDDENMSMIFLLPEDVEMNDLIDTLTYKGFERILSQMYLQPVGQLMIPKFEIECEINVRQALFDLGIANVFSSTADLSNLSENIGYVGGALQKTVFSIDEQGVTAASTGVMVMRRSVPSDFICNRPFMYFLYDNESNNIVVQGIIETL